MRELHLVAHESNATSLVLCAEDSDEQFFLAVDDSLLEILTSPDAAPTEARQDATPPPATPEPPPADPVPELAPTAEEHTPEQESRPSGPLTMRPREIQERIRGGASIAEIAEAIGVRESRIEPFAHPILLERSRMAELAKRALPVRDDGPASLTLWEILATAFAARDIDLTTSKWDSYRDPSGQWVVKVTWQSGISENSAEWSYHPRHQRLPHRGSPQRQRRRPYRPPILPASPQPPPLRCPHSKRTNRPNPGSLRRTLNGRRWLLGKRGTSYAEECENAGA